MIRLLPIFDKAWDIQRCIGSKQPVKLIVASYSNGPLNRLNLEHANKIPMRPTKLVPPPMAYWKNALYKLQI